MPGELSKNKAVDAVEKRVKFFGRDSDMYDRLGTLTCP